jgi:hypothetical protein
MKKMTKKSSVLFFIATPAIPLNVGGRERKTAVIIGTKY